MARNRTRSADTWVVDLPPTALQSWSAAAVAAVLLTGLGGLAPFAGQPLAELNAFFPSLDAIVFVTDLITSVLLFAQLSIFNSRSLLVLANGYLFTALIVIPHALTFSGAFSQTGLLGANIQTGSWLYIFWHIGFGAALLAYAMLREEERPTSVSRASMLSAITWSVVGMFGLVCGLAWLTTAGIALLPAIIRDGTHISPLASYYVAFATLLSAAALAVLLFRQRSALDNWLMVVALASVLELVFSGLLPSVRFSLGFYVGRVLSIVTSSVVLIVLLIETTLLYVRLARSNAMLQHAQNNKLMNLEAAIASLSHEIRQPVTAMTANSSAALHLIENVPPGLEEARSALADVISSGQQIGEILTGLRALFAKIDHRREPINANETALEALRLVRGDVVDNGVLTRVELASDLPLINGSKGQLQEVITNLLSNAIEAMSANLDSDKLLTVRTRSNDKSIIIEVEDTGQGIDPAARDHMFEAFVTTKPSGMGLGLAICRTIVERHEGQLTARPANRRGSVFRIVLPKMNILS